MKRITCILLTCILCFSISGCTKTYKGTDELIEKAREEIPVSDADTIDMQYGGMCTVDDTALVWFISGNQYQTHYYLPMEVEIKGEAEYAYVRTYKPMSPFMDIAVLNWNRGYAFIVNNPNCVSVKITDEAGTHEEMIEKDAYPYVFYCSSVPSEYVFIDAEGNETSATSNLKGGS